jgi:hypothetical protein
MRFRKVAGLLALVLAVAGFPTVADACPVCYGDSDSPMAQGLNNAVLFLLGVVVLVQIGFAALFYSFWKRSTAMRRRRDQFRLIPGMKL